jgi:drug/metabolite transporter (DMT)-like permease
LTPLLLALAASLVWGVADFVGPVWARTLGTLRVLLWGQVGGVLAIGLAVAIRGDGPRGAAVLLAIAASVSGTAGLYAYYRGVAIGAMSVVAPIAGASAVIPVAWGVARGDRPTAVQIAGVVCALVGVVFASREHPATATRRIAAGAGLALLAAVGFGFYFPPMHAAGEVDFWWTALVFRVTTLLVVGSAVAVQRPALRLRRRDLLVCAAVGIGDTLGNTLYAAASRSGLESLTAVLASLYPIVTVALAAVFLKELLAGAQRLGIALTLAGVVLISV